MYYQMVGRDGDFIVSSSLGDFDVRRQLKDLKIPVLILAGRYDGVSTPEMVVLYKKYCPQAEFVMFEKSGHVSFLEEPEKIVDVLRKFLRK